VLDFETYAFVDGDNTTQAAVAVNPSGNKYQLIFPRFASSLVYDPTVSTVSSGASALAVGGAILLALVAAMVNLF
jgi:hypothetical protein